MEYSDSQVQAAQNMADLHGLECRLSREQCIQFLDWWHEVKASTPQPKTELEAIVGGLSGSIEPNMESARQKLIDIMTMRG